MTLDDIEFLQFVNDQYINNFQSLNKTCQWLEEEYGIRVNRIKLSRLFHNNNLAVQAPNGKPALWYGEDTATWRSKETEFAAEWIQLLFDDITGHIDGGEPRINYMSACWAFSGVVYEKMLLALQSGGPLLVGTSTLPPGLDEHVILEGRDLYHRNKHYWVDSIGT